MTRYHDWQTRLDRYIAEHRDTPFSWNPGCGLNCCTWTFGAIEVMTGINIGAQFEGQYSTRREALKVMQRYCGRPYLPYFIGRLMLIHEFKPVPCAFAGRGDVVMCMNGAGEYFVGVCDLNGRDVLGIGEGGIRRVKKDAKCRAWRVG